ncbi:MAG: phosphoribosyl-ATP diphosphatase [Clostridiales bacterium]|nr:phosphoribosyl-ATP diphosphatase [Clostridiales bacterium]
MNSIQAEYDVILERKKLKEEGSYTAYLFDKGIDKILKKVGEECTEMIIAAKNDSKEEIIFETADLIYHTLVMLADRGITPGDIESELQKRAAKRKNLKEFHQVDKNS